MKKRIFLYYMILIIIGVSVTGFFTSQLAQKFYKFEVEEKLKNTATLIEYQLSQEINKGDKIDYDAAAIQYAKLLNHSSQANIPLKEINTRVTFIDFNGNVLGESQTNFHEMENHLSRKEIQEAIQGKTGEDIRFSKTLKMDFLYIAIPLKISDIVIRVSVPLIQLEKIDKIIWYYTAVGIFIGLILTSLLALKFSSSVTRPIKELIATLKEISLGNYSNQVDIKSKDEIGQLAETFNEMAQKLDKTVADLIDKNIKVDSIINSMISGIVAVDNKYRIILINTMAREMFNIKSESDVLGTNILEAVRNNQINNFLEETIQKDVPIVSEITFGRPEDKILRIYTNPIKASAEKGTNSGGIVFIQDITNIRKLEQIRTEFVSNVTHELKTPLTSIRGFVETLRNGAIKDEEVSEKFLEIIDIEAERLYMLINDILQLSEIETKQKDSNIDKYNVKEIVEETISILQGLADKKQINLICEINEDIMIVANRDRIKQMLINLVENSIKYNIENGEVCIKVSKSFGKIVFNVKDTGIGISQEHIPRIFERFYRVDKGRSRSMGGTGLGLSIVKHIVNLYNGDIKVSSTPGKGTEFTIQLPT